MEIKEEQRNQQQQEKKLLFSERALVALVIPLVIERFLDMVVGIADTAMVSSVGETAVSGLSLVDNISNLVIFVLAALATGGAVVISQYLGRDDRKNARIAAKQLLYTTFAFALVLAGICIGFCDGLLHLIFGELELEVMQSASTYLLFIAATFPFIAIFNSIAATFRSMGNSKMSLIISLGMNLLNIIGNAIFIYGFGWGVLGAGLSTLISRVVASGVMLYLIRDHRNAVFMTHILKIELKPAMISSIMKIGIPSGLENGMFHLGRLIVYGIITSLGTAAIAANAVAGRIVAFTQVPGAAVSMAIVTVVGQCMGAGDYEQAAYYTKKLMIKYTYIPSAILCLIMFLFSNQLLMLFNLSAEAVRMGTEVMQLFCVVTAVIYPIAFPFANVLRSAGDAKFPMIVSIISMWVVRVGLSYVFHYAFDIGLQSIWLAMYADWLVRAVFFLLRYKSGKWKTMKVID
ncbi:MATE family efflux transporter [Christensenellaceae bacterium OttesenSCG-928-M15]|nr:MATE family efflux transporter [Christensenellaceae bacterium OttesenSCG-928-M15]